MAGDLGSVISSLVAQGAMNGEQMDPNALAAADPRLERVLTAATDTVAPTDDKAWKNENLAFAGGIAQNPLGGVLSGFGAQVGQRNKQAELLGQYLPIIAPVLQQQKLLQLQAHQAQMAYLPNGGLAPGAAQGALAGQGQGDPGAVGASPQGGAPGAPGPLGMAGGAPSSTQGMMPGSRPMQPQGNMFGMIPNQAAQMAFASGQQGPLFQSYMEQFKPTPETLSANQAGVDPAAANYTKLVGLMRPEPMGRSGAMFQATPQGPRYFGVTSSLPMGMAPTFDRNGNETGAHMVGNVQKGISDNAAAERQGTNRETPGMAYDGNDNPIGATVDEIVRSQQGGAPNGRYNPGGGAPGGAAGAPGGAPLKTGLGPGEEVAQRGKAEGAVKLYNNDATAANGFAGRMFTLNKALTGLQGADTGKGGETVNDIRNFLTAQSPEMLKRAIPGFDAMALKSANYDEANKYLMQYAMAQAGAMGQGTDEKLAAALSGNANTHINNLAAQDVVRANMGLERMRQAQVAEFDKAGNNVRNYQTFSTHWNKDIDPRVFVVDTLPPDKALALKASMTPSEMSKFVNQYNWALKNRYIDGRQ